MVLQIKIKVNLMMPFDFVRPILHKYANEDVSLGSWFIGLEVNHIDERNMCCGTPPGLPHLKQHLSYYFSNLF